MIIVKRDGSEQPFDAEKIAAAVRAANTSIPEAHRIDERRIGETRDLVVDDVCRLHPEGAPPPSVEEVQNLVENQLMDLGAHELARHYINYRQIQALKRQGNTTDDKILSLLALNNDEAKGENANKNPVLISTQRDYMAGEVSRDITRRILLPEEVQRAHDEGTIHFHDADYFAQTSHNCFSADTAFLTEGGERRFAECEEGETVTVLDLNGTPREARVHCFGDQKVQRVALTRKVGVVTERREVTCTPNHRWILADGSVTTALAAGMELYRGTAASPWHVESVEPRGSVERVWCVTEPVTHTFTLAGGVPTGNCELVNLEDMLQNGTVISETMIERPHSFSTACNIATQIIAQVASNTYGGQTLTLAHLSPFVDVSRRRIAAKVDAEFSDAGIDATAEQRARVVADRLADEVTKGVQTIQYQILTLLTTNGQTPFVSLNLDLTEVAEGPERDDLAMVVAEVLRQRIAGVKNEAGAPITPAFPKLLYVLDDINARPGSPYFWLTRLAAECTAARMVPDYISAKIMRQEKGDVYPCMGCRSFLTPDRFSDVTGDPSGALTTENHPHKYYGRFNQGVVTINLPDVALSAKGDAERFWEIFDERLELCHRALRLRHEHLLGTPTDVAPILWQHGALARLPKGAVIDPLLYGGYSTLSLGYAGLYECTLAMCGVSHTDPAGKPFALSVMQHMNDKCAEWKAAENIDYSLYGTPLESTTYKFAKALQRRHGIVAGVTDHGYITNSYHVNVREEIDAFTKLGFEAEFQRLSPGGAISYVEVPDMKGNIEAVLAVIEYIFDHIMYAELNTKSDYCQECGYDGEIACVEDENGKLVWECPRCGNRDQATLNVARRTCGYIGTQFWNQGRTEEIRDRVLHL